MWSFLIILALVNGDPISMIKVEGLGKGHRFQSQSACEKARLKMFDMIEPPSKGRVLEFTQCIQDTKDT